MAARDPRSSGTLVDAQGRATHLAMGDFTLTAGRTFKAPSGAVYPIDWTIPFRRSSSPRHLHASSESGTGDEGLRRRLLGRTGGCGRHVARRRHPGKGYLEMTGYKGSLGRVMTQ